MNEPVIYRPPLLVMIPLADEMLAEIIAGMIGTTPYDAAIMVYCGPRADQPSHPSAIVEK